MDNHREREQEAKTMQKQNKNVTHSKLSMESASFASIAANPNFKSNHRWLASGERDSESIDWGRETMAVLRFCDIYIYMPGPCADK